MFLKKLKSDPKKAMRAGTALLVAGLALGVIATSWTRTVIGAAFPGNWSDFARGICFGLGITLECSAIVLLMAARKRAH